MSKDDYSELFKLFWERYPKVENSSKKTAARAFERLTTIEKQAAIDGISGYLQYLKKESWQKPAHAATWLNQKRWETVKVERTIPDAEVPATWKQSSGAHFRFLERLSSLGMSNLNLNAVHAAGFKIYRDGDNNALIVADGRANDILTANRELLKKMNKVRPHVWTTAFYEHYNRKRGAE